MRHERVGENLNQALHQAFDSDPRVYLLGEDLLDPYGGAFNISSGLSTKYPDRVITTPLSEGGFMGVANGLALCGDKPIVEVMFGDFIALCFDQIVNFATKSVSMYGRRQPMQLLVRCPVGGNRGYGPTHSQSLQKHFIGVPHLSLFELSPFHDNRDLLPRLLGSGEPAILFEDKTLYTRRVYRDGVVDDLFRFEFLDAERNYARVFIEGTDRYDWLVIAPGGLADQVLAAARDLFVRLEIACQIVVPARLFPFDLDALLGLVQETGAVCVVEESTAGGTWGAEVARRMYEELWAELARPVLLLSSRDSVIPTAAHLERQVLIQGEAVYRAIKEAAGA